MGSRNDMTLRPVANKNYMSITIANEYSLERYGQTEERPCNIKIKLIKDKIK